MLEFCLFILICCFVFGFIYAAITGWQKGKMSGTSCHSTNHISSQNVEHKEQRERLLNNISIVFDGLGWNDWESNVHWSSGQYDRLFRALSEKMYFNWYNPDVGIAKVISSSHNCYLVSKSKCSCPDFKDRKLPCKHIYFLAVNVNDYENMLVTDTFGSKADFIEDTALSGLKFSLSGRGQEPVKRYINSHSGTFGKYSKRETSAVIVVDDNTTNMILEAQIDGVYVITIDDLKCIVSGRKEKSPAAD